MQGVAEQGGGAQFDRGSTWVWRLGSTEQGESQMVVHVAVVCVGGSDVGDEGRLWCWRSVCGGPTAHLWWLAMKAGLLGFLWLISTIKTN